MTLGSGLEGYAFAFKNASSFEIVVKKDIPCTSFSSVKIDTKKRGMLQKLIEGQFRLHFQLDGLPVLMRSKESHYPVKGAAVGFVAPPMYAGLARNTMYLFNHFKFVITYQEDPSMYQGVRITGFDVFPVSKKHDESLSTCSGIDVVNRPTEYLLDLDDVMLEQNVVFSYDVKWVQSELEWVDRWDVYFLGLPGLPDDDIHYFGMSNSLMNILIMTCLISIILIRIFRKDIVGGGKKETGWKHVHADVFRPPSFSPMLLSVFVGNGVHLGTAAILTMILNVLNFTNTMTTGAVLTSLILVYALCGPICGYVSARLYKLFGGDDCKRNAALAAAALPGGSLAAFCLVNIFVWVDGGTTVDFMSMLVLVILFCCVAVPLVLLGDRIGRLAPCIEVPTTTSDAVRPIPVSKWTKGKSPAMFAGGLLILSTMNIELHFIMGALWVKQYYVTMGVLLMSTLIMVIACAQVSICICYCQLYCEDHRWWWASFRNCASTSVFMALYSLWYLNRLQLIGGLSVLIYLTYMSLASICIGLVCGSIGFLASLWFTRTIYGALQIDRSLKDVEDVGNESVPLTNGCEESSDSK
jgi:transmembrane 9 superfamily protein 2/4